MAPTWSATRCAGAARARSRSGSRGSRGWRYVIVDGYGSVARAPGRAVFGVLWRLTPRDLAALNIFESLDSGLYRRAMLTVRGRRQARARAGLCRAAARPAPRRCPGYQERLVAAATEWHLPPRYVAELRRLAPGYRGARPAETGEIG